MSAKDDVPDVDRLLEAAIMEEIEPSDLLKLIQRALHTPDEPDDSLAGSVGAGPLETLVQHHGDELWPQIESFARDDPRFRRALRMVWGFSSEEVGDRCEALLEELGEHQTTWVRFVVYRDDFAQQLPLRSRAADIEGSVPQPELSRILHEIADWAARAEPETRPAWVSDPTLSNAVREWRDALQLVLRTQSALLCITDPKAFGSELSRIEQLRAAERPSWEQLKQAHQQRPPARFDVAKSGPDHGWTSLEHEGSWIAYCQMCGRWFDAQDEQGITDDRVEHDRLVHHRP